MEFMNQKFELAKKQLDLELHLTDEEITQIEERIMKKIRVRKLPLRWIVSSIAAITVISFSIPIIYQTIDKSKTHEVSGTAQTKSTTPISHRSSEPRPGDKVTINGEVQKYGAYVIHNNSYYSATGEEISLDQLGDSLGPVKRQGTWENKKEGDSNIYQPISSLMYKLNGVDETKEIVLRIKRNTLGEKVPDDSYKYEIFKYVAKVEQVDTTTILNATGDIREVHDALQNINRINANLLVVEEQTENTELFQTQYENTQNGSITSLVYTVKGLNNSSNQGSSLTDGIKILEYSEKLKTSIPGGFFWKGDSNSVPSTMPPVQKEFELNGLHWKEYSSLTYLAQKGDHYYEIVFQGQWNEDRVMKILTHFTKMK